MSCPLERAPRAGAAPSWCCWQGLIVTDTEVLHLAVAEIAASHDVELARDPAGDMLRQKKILLDKMRPRPLRQT